MSDTASSIAEDSDDSESSSVWSSPVKQTNSRPGLVGCGPCRPPPTLPPSHRFNVIQKMNMRQLYGKVKEKRRGPEMRMFSRLPGRLAFFIRDVVPQSALCAGHVFLGFTGCGQFLLSYTQTATDADISDQYFNYYYRLHWWLFTPYSKAKKVAEVTLFTNQGVYGNLLISVCQWPGDLSRLVVYGYQTHDPDSDEVLAGSLHCYLTVTNTPSLSNCSDCVKVASSYDADDVAAAWNSCVRLSCLRHGATVHTQFDLVPPYPKFEPKISLKRAGCVVINTGNFLHAISMDLETLGGAGQRQEEEVLYALGGAGRRPEEEVLFTSTLEHTFRGITPLSPPCNPISVHVGMAEFAFGTEGSPGGFSPASVAPTSDSENTDVESESSYPTRSTNKVRSKRPFNFLGTAAASRRDLGTKEKMEKIQEFKDKLSPNDKASVGREARFKERLFRWDEAGAPGETEVRGTKPERLVGVEGGRRMPGGEGPSRDGFQFTVPPTPGTSEKKRKLADEAYDLTDDNFATDLPEKLSTFRRKRLAEKKYEFTEDEEDDQKLYPITRLRTKTMRENTSVLSRVLHGSSQDLMVCVSERKYQPSTSVEREEARVEEDCWADMLDGASYPELFSPGGCIKKDANSMSPRLYQAMSPKVMSSAISPRSSYPEFYCRARFTRRYIEVDDELISVITDVEDDDLGATTGFHSALPLEVHGSGYTQMQMISNSKAEKLQLECVRVQQRSLDLEQFCHETATRLCAEAHKKFWYCNDYDVEVVDVDPNSGDVIVVAVVLIQAAILTKSQSQKFNVSSLSRKQYQASFKFCWNLESGHYCVVDSDPLKEISGFKEQGVQWNPARNTAAPLLKTFGCPNNSIKCLTNESVIRGVSLKAIIDPDNLVALIMNDLE